MKKKKNELLNCSRRHEDSARKNKRKNELFNTRYRDRSLPAKTEYETRETNEENKVVKYSNKY